MLALKATDALTRARQLLPLCLADSINQEGTTVAWIFERQTFKMRLQYSHSSLNYGCRLSPLGHAEAGIGQAEDASPQQARAFAFTTLARA